MKLNINTLEIDISNTCGNTCQGCYHNKLKNTKLTSLEDFNFFIYNFFSIINNDNIESLAFYGGNLLEKESFLSYMDIILDYNDKIGYYLVSTSFGNYTTIAKENLEKLFLLFGDKSKFIFQFFYNPEYFQEYYKCLKDILKIGKLRQLFFAIQLHGFEKNYIKNLIRSLNLIFIKLGIKDKKFFIELNRNLENCLEKKIRTENFCINLGELNILFMFVYPVNKLGKKITSVCGQDCSFFSSTKIDIDNIYINMLSIEYDGYVNFHNPNCIASLQRIFHILDDKRIILKKIIYFLKFLFLNQKKNMYLLDKCNSCLKFNLSNKGIFEKK